jgi:hypothetical protein
MKAGDILNWPPDVELRIVNKLKLEELERLHELVKADKLDFSPEFLHRIQLERMSSNDQYSYDRKFKSDIVKYHPPQLASKRTSKRDKLGFDVRKYLAEKLANELKGPRIEIPWLEMTVRDILNWPQDVEFKKVSKLKIEELEKLHKLAKENQLDFSPEFINRLKLQSSKTSKRDQLKLDIIKYLQGKLSSNLNVPRIRIPWSKIKAGDIINWPANVPFQNIKKINAAEITRLHELVKADKLDFSSDFIKRLQNGKRTSN